MKINQGNSKHLQNKGEKSYDKYEEKIGKIQLLFMVRILSKLEVKGNTFSLKKQFCKNPIENIISNSELSKVSHSPK